MINKNQVHLTPDSYVVLITTNHISNEAAMRTALKTPVSYIGMIGSPAKCKTMWLPASTLREWQYVGLRRDA